MRLQDHDSATTSPPHYVEALFVCAINIHDVLGLRTAKDYCSTADSKHFHTC
jgi:hypothetical protein